MNKIKKASAYIESILPTANFDTYAVGIVDFTKDTFEVSGSKSYFDIASMTKPLTFGIAYLIHKEKFSKEMLLLLHHKSGLLKWGRLDKKSWREQILSYPIKESEVVYSDFGALRLQLEIEKKLGLNLYDISSPYWDDELKHWLDLEGESCAFTGRRNRRVIHGEVHDDNAFIIGEKVAHAGLFSTINGICKTLLKLNKELKLISTVGIDHQDRFIFGWDSVENIDLTLASSKASKNTFGHLGFTGTSMWIDPEKKLGVVLLTNEVQGHWYERRILNDARREVARIAFSQIN